VTPKTPSPQSKTLARQLAPHCRNADFPVGASRRLENRRYETARVRGTQNDADAALPKSALLGGIFLNALFDAPNMAAAHAFDFAAQLDITPNSLVIQDAETVDNRAGSAHAFNDIFWI
jgi:hypothetical protein